MKTMIMRRGVLVAFAAIATIGFGSCKKSGESGSGAAPAAGGGAKQYKFAFVTNNSADFWNIAGRASQKAEKDLGIKAEVFRPLKGELAEQQRYLEDVMVQDFDGMAVCAGQPGLDDAAAGSRRREDAGHLHDSDAPKSKRNAYVGTNNIEAGARRRRRRAEGPGRQAARARSRCSSVASTCRTRSSAAPASRRCCKAARPRDPARVPRRHRPRQGEEERRGRAGPLSRPGADDRPLVVQRPVHGRRRPRVVAQGEAGDRRVRRGRGDAEGRRGRPHLRDHRAEAVRVRLSVDEAAQGHQGRQAGAGQREPGHRHDHARKT